MAERSTDALLQEMIDREAIRDLASRYAHLVWQKDVPAILDLFTEDGEVDTGDRPAIRGRDALRQAYQGMLAGDEFQPFIHNHVVELDGDRATGTCYLDLRASIGGRSMTGAGYYQDRYVKVGGEWKFRSRKLTMIYLVPAGHGWAEPKDSAPDA